MTMLNVERFVCAASQPPPDRWGSRRRFAGKA